MTTDEEQKRRELVDAMRVLEARNIRYAVNADGGPILYPSALNCSQAIACACLHVFKKYEWLGRVPDSFGIWQPSAWEYWKQDFGEAHVEEGRPGDLVFYNRNEHSKSRPEGEFHVMIFTGAGVIGACNEAGRVHEHKCVNYSKGSMDEFGNPVEPWVFKGFKRVPLDEEWKKR